uniref:Uncharacterized protein n=1 Tax=Anguilla anguilla TaxID=7936 RepID=A0A0E9W0R1_ANGAN
MLLALPLTVTG